MLTLNEPGAEVRERFLAGELTTTQAEHAQLLTHWTRARERGVAADGVMNGDILPDSVLRERRQRLAGLLHAERSVLDPLAAELASRSLLALLADADGVVLHQRGGGDFADAARAVRLVEGACWSETARGTNAIGTAISERGPVAVLGGAHFERRNAGLFCYAAPIRDLYGDVLCVLDVSGTMAAHDPAIGMAVRASGAALELLLRTQTFANVIPGGLDALARLVERLREPAFVLDLRQQVLCAGSAAHGVLSDLGFSRDGVSGPGKLRLPTGVDGMLRAPTGTGDVGRSHDKHAAQQLLWHGAKHAYQLCVEPLCDPAGRAIAHLVTVQSQQATRQERRKAAALAPALDRSERSDSNPFASLLGADPELQREKERAQLYAATDLPVLLLAETGTGKELFARAIHAASPRRDGPFIAVNCGSIPETLLASELFGHAPHAFTGANRRGAEGKLSAADGGTLFLDEAADMSAALQCALLRFLDDGSYQRVGETQVRRANVRIVCATCRDLLAHVESGKFRQDLFYRIQGASISPPPVRMRSDTLVLASQLLDQLGGGSLSPSAQQHILTHDWPGNVRELKSALQHARALARGELIESAHLPQPLLGHAGAPPSRRATLALASESATTTIVPRKQVLRDAVQEALRATNGNLSEAARLLRMSRTTLYRMLKQS